MRSIVVLAFVVVATVAIVQGNKAEQAPAQTQDKTAPQTPPAAVAPPPQCTGKNEVYKPCVKACNARTCANYKLQQALKQQGKSHGAQSAQPAQPAPPSQNQQPPAAPAAPAAPACTCTPSDKGGCDCAPHHYRNAANECVPKEKC